MLPGYQVSRSLTLNLAWLERRAAESGAMLVAETQGIFVGFRCRIGRARRHHGKADSNRFGRPFGNQWTCWRNRPDAHDIINYAQ
jgi:hypothetical protein